MLLSIIKIFLATLYFDGLDILLTISNFATMPTYSTNLKVY